MNSEDQFLEELMNDGSALDYWIQNIPDSSESSISDLDEHHVIYAKKRKYEWKSPPQLQENVPKQRTSRNYTISLPRILKSDIRRKFISMYENVMNSYNYHLISSFFQQFFLPTLRFEKKNIFTSPTKYLTILDGVQPVLCYFLLLLQMCPDKITRVSQIQLKQSSNDIDHTEVSCKFNVRNTTLYQTTPLHFVEILQRDLGKMCGFENNSTQDRPSEELLSMTKRKRKLEKGVQEEVDRHQSLFDPISGVFLKSRFPRNDLLTEFEVEGYMSLIVNNSNKIIEKIIVTPMERIQLSLHEEKVTVC